MKKYSLAHLTVLNCPPPEMTYMAAMAGYDYVSYRLISRGMPEKANYDLSTDRKMFKETKAALKDTGLSLYDIELARIDEGIDVRSYEQRIAAGAELGAKTVLSSIWTDRKEFAIEQFALLCDIAKSYEMNVELEFVTYAAVNTLQKVVSILKTVDRTNAGLLIDTLHFNRSRTKEEDLDALPKEWFRLAHVCDAEPEIPDSVEALMETAKKARLYIGEGGIDIPAVMNKLPEDMVCSIELPNIKRVAEYGEFEHVCRCLKTAKAVIGK